MQAAPIFEIVGLALASMWQTTMSPFCEFGHRRDDESSKNSASRQEFVEFNEVAKVRLEHQPRSIHQS